MVLVITAVKDATDDYVSSPILSSPLLYLLLLKTVKAIFIS